jgi:predicted O-methyltransferase YrrM
MIRTARTKLRKFIGMDEYFHLQQKIIELNDISELMKVFAWDMKPILDNPLIHKFENFLDVNQRRIRDAEALGTVVKNINPTVCLDIGTAEGQSAALIAINAPQAIVYTINISPDDIINNKGGRLTTVAMEREKIGSYYRERNLKNIKQIVANTATWEPDIGNIDLVFVDGCHDTDFVYNDTCKSLKFMKPGAFVLWHDFNFDLVKKYDWINSVCFGVEKLYQTGLLTNYMFHVRDSWIGIYQVI